MSEAAMEPSTSALIMACRRGEEAAWVALVDRYQRLVYSVPRRAGLDPEQTADVFQQVFTTLIEQIDVIEQPERLGAWLVTTARRASWRMQQRATRSQPLPAAMGVELDVRDPAPLPDEVIEQLEAQHQVRTALGQLDERCQTLLTLLFYRPTPPAYEELAAQLSLRVGSIGPTRARCLEKLRQLLGS